MFAIPYEKHYTLIGTTDQDYEDDPARVRITDDEIRYLCAAVSRYFRSPVTPDQVCWSYAGVRPLYDDASADVSAVTRDYVFDLDAENGIAPLLSVFGGKITTYRKLAEHALQKLQPVMKFERGAWTERAPLPGGDMPGADFRTLSRRSRAYDTTGCLVLWRSATGAPTEPGSTLWSARRAASTISASTWATGSTRLRWSIW